MANLLKNKFVDENTRVSRFKKNVERKNSHTKFFHGRRRKMHHLTHLGLLEFSCPNLLSNFNCGCDHYCLSSVFGSIQIYNREGL